MIFACSNWKQNSLRKGFLSAPAVSEENRKLQRAATGTILTIASRILKLLCKNRKGRADGSARIPGKPFWSHSKRM